MASANNTVQEANSEIGVFEFIVNNQSFGVNVLKIRQIVRFEADKLSLPPRPIPSMIGLIKIQNRMVPIIDLNHAFYNKSNSSLENSDTDQSKKNQIILVLEFNRSWFGFLVDNVDKIHRLNSEEVKGIENGFSIEYINSTVSLTARTIFILDFEYLVSDLFYSEENMEIKPISSIAEIESDILQKRILLVDDSKVSRDIVFNFLKKIGFQNLEVASNGKEGFDKYTHQFNSESMASHYDLIISDIEMPQCDGFTFCKNIKKLKHNQKFILLSSLANKRLQVQCEEVGVDKLVSKRDIERLHLIINTLYQTN